MNGNEARKGSDEARWETVRRVLMIGGACLLAVFIAVGGLVGLGVGVFRGSSRASNERNAAGSLKTFTTAEADFRANDRDGNRVPDY